VTDEEFSYLQQRYVRFRQRQTILLAADEAAYSEVLCQEFPGIRFIDGVVRSLIYDRSRPPESPIRASIRECQHPYVGFVFDPDWPFRWRWLEDSNEWHPELTPLPNGMIERITRIGCGGGFRDKPEDGTNRGEGCVYIRILAGNAEHEAVARKALRLLGRVASNKKLLIVRRPSMQVITDKAIAAPWIGWDARRWCLEKPDRVLSNWYRPWPPDYAKPAGRRKK
jgi:hypothetical protein